MPSSPPFPNVNIITDKIKAVWEYKTKNWNTPSVEKSAAIVSLFNPLLVTSIEACNFSVYP